MAAAALSCGAGEPSERNLARNNEVLEGLPLPDGTTRVAIETQRHDVRGRYCVDITRWTMRTPEGDEPALVAFFERELGRRGWTAQRADVGGGESVDYHLVNFEGKDAWVDLNTEGFNRDKEYELDTGRPC